jgi:hypothetical protein
MLSLGKNLVIVALVGDEDSIYFDMIAGIEGETDISFSF